ncbi:MAG: hypothetical protein PVJ09_00130 [Candidatus Woesebacteria bacterium]|jgi:F0F1-type ATP synthase epsilon subunit
MDKIKIKIFSLKGLILEEEVDAISSENEEGVFDVLPQHSNFISIIKNKLILHKNKKKFKEIKLDLGVIRLIANQAKIYLDLESTG